MPSPFPGMDPFLEGHWRSVHHRLITYAGDRLQEILPRRFRVEVEERVFVSGGFHSGRDIAPDISILERRRDDSSVGTSATGSGIGGAPVIICLPDEPVTESFLEIIDTASGNRIVTAIEFLSPTNKIPGDGNDLYIQKQRELRAARASLVEIDLTRQGKRDLVFPMTLIRQEHRATYLTCVRRGWQPQRIELYPMPLRFALPTVYIPLDQSLADLPLSLQEIVDQVYNRGRYEDIDYRVDPRPPVDYEDAKWVDELLREKGVR